ncbi:MAG: FtsW/RodA/SpoVE family cell cycle protein [Planctomycetota bacterium]|nr:FtsW/RodA/SpoVE family cell cycle protein [Planctomycetota bacterium]
MNPLFKPWIKDWKEGWFGAALLLLLTTGWLLVVGTIFVHSAADGPEGGFPGPYSSSHMKKILVGLGGMLALSFIPSKYLERFSGVFFWGTIGLLALLLLWKWAQGGVVRWIRIGGFGMQPSELAKISTVLLVAHLLRSGERLGQWSSLFKVLAVAGLPFLMIAAQPDLGTALILAPTVAAMIWVGGIDGRKFVILVFAAVLIVGSCGWPLLTGYQQDRLRSYMGIGEVAQESEGGYQVAQSIIAIGSGGPTGRGLHLGSHHDLGYLPEDHNDFIFSVIGEEWGLVGTISVILAFLVLVLTMLGVAWNCRDPFGRLVAVGLATQIGIQATINQAVTVGLLPVTGMPLPLISYGGTSIVVTLMGIGIVISVARKPVEVIHPDGLQRGVSDVIHRSIRAPMNRHEGSSR